MNAAAGPLADLKLYMLLLGSKAPQRNVEQHDYFFGIARSLKELVPEIKAFWPEAGNSIHLDGWREVNTVDGYQIRAVLKEGTSAEDSAATQRQEAAEYIAPAQEVTPTHTSTPPGLFFINLGGYQENTLEEQHYIVLTVQHDRAQATQHAKKTAFFKKNSIKGANSHIDEKYGIDVDDIYRIEEILSASQKERFQINISPAADLPADKIHLGYFKLDKL
jgi:hypothetical protein